MKWKSDVIQWFKKKNFSTIPTSSKSDYKCNSNQMKWFFNYLFFQNRKKKYFRRLINYTYTCLHRKILGLVCIDVSPDQCELLQWKFHQSYAYQDKAYQNCWNSVTHTCDKFQQYFSWNIIYYYNFNIFLHATKITKDLKKKFLDAKQFKFFTNVFLEHTSFMFKVDQSENR